MKNAKSRFAGARDDGGRGRTSSQTSWASRPFGTMSRVLFGLEGGNSMGSQPVMVLGRVLPTVRRAQPERVDLFGNGNWLGRNVLKAPDDRGTTSRA